MATVSKKIADEVIAGKYPEDNIVAIVKYQNHFNGGDAYGLVAGNCHVDDYLLSPYCHNPVIYWEK